MSQTAPPSPLELEPVSFGRRVATLSARHGDAVAITFVPQEGAPGDISWDALERRTNQVARFLADFGVGPGSAVVIGLPNCPEHLMVAIAGWKLGALVLPLNARLPVPERQALLELATPAAVVAHWEGPAMITPDQLDRSQLLADEALPDVVSHPGKAIASGGSTGRPKIIVDPNPFAFPPDALKAMTRTWAGIDEGEVQLVSGPLDHNLPFSWAHLGLFLDHRLVLMDHFDAERAVDIIEQQRVTFAPLVPTTMQRILMVPGIGKRHLGSLRSVMHTAAPCPAWVKRGWIELIGADKVYEAFGSTEGVGACVIRGDEWLEHPGSVGRPSSGTELKILDDAGGEVAAGEVGEIFMRMRQRPGASYEYIGSSPATTTEAGLVSVGDLGWVDEEGYLHIADRRVDLIITGGANVYPAEVELVLAEHPGVFDNAVVGLPSDEWGKQVHAIVQPVDPAHPPTVDDLDSHCRRHLAAYKVPKSYEFVDELPRDEAGKIRRSALASERAGY